LIKPCFTLIPGLEGRFLLIQGNILQVYPGLFRLSRVTSFRYRSILQVHTNPSGYPGRSFHNKGHFRPKWMQERTQGLTSQHKAYPRTCVFQDQAQTIFKLKDLANSFLTGRTFYWQGITWQVKNREYRKNETLTGGVITTAFLDIN